MYNALSIQVIIQIHIKLRISKVNCGKNEKKMNISR